MSKRHLYIQLDTTNDCNLACSHCYHNKEGNKEHIQEKQKVLSSAQIFSLIDDLKETSERWNMVPRIAFSGGEPLMRKDLTSLLEYANRKDVLTNILSNGTLIGDYEAREFKKLGVSVVQISIDGSKKTHNKIRNKSFAYDRAINGIRKLAKEEIPVTVSMTAMNSNKDEFRNVVERSIESGASRVGFKTYVPDASLGANDPEYLGPERIYDLMKDTLNIIEELGDRIEILQSEVLWQVFNKTSPLKEEAKKQLKYLGGCSAGYSSLSVLSDGTVYPCRRLPISIGHINEGIKELILNKEIMEEFRDLKKMKERTLCDKVVHCRGCRAVAYAVTGDYLAKDPMCYKHLIEND